MKRSTTISKVCCVLTELRHHPSMGVTDLARRTGLLPSDVHRILNSLRPYGFVEQNPENRTYRLGVGLMKLGLSAFQRHELREAARPTLQRLSQELGAAAHLAILDPREPDIFLAEQVDYSREVPLQVRFGATAEAHCTALGKAVIANIPWETACLFLQKNGMRRLTANTITDVSALRADLRQTALRGYGLDIEESAAGACCVGAPIRGGDGDAAGAISVSMASRRFHKQPDSSIVAPVMAAAAQISAIFSNHRSPDLPDPLASSR
jgi:DNA-binding IclR family transcriptional regulator